MVWLNRFRLSFCNKQNIKNYFFENKWFILYVALLSLPNILMFYVNPSVKGIVPNLVNFLLYEILLLLPLIFLKLRVFMAIWLLFILLVPMEIVHIVNYDGYTTLPALSSGLDSNPAEMGEFISNYRHIFLLGFIIFPLAVLSTFKTSNRKTSSSEKTVLILFFTLICMMFSVRTVSELGMERFLVDQKKLYSRLFTSGYPTAYFYNLATYYSERKKLLASIKVKKHFLFGVNINEKFNQQKRIALLIIGETSRAKNWSLNGYPRETNPKLKNLKNLVNFNSAITSATHTRESIQLALTRARPENLEPIYKEKSIIGAYKEAGYKTIWVSNQNKISPVDTPVTAIAKESDDQIFTNKDYEVNPSFDEDLLPIIKAKLADNQGKLLLIVHTLGSHEIYRKRYPKEFEKYIPVTSGDDYNFSSDDIREKLVNSYDNSILYTDHIIVSIVEFLKETNEIGFMMYFSDHGENLLDDGGTRFGHGGVIPTNYVLEIPLLAWFSDSYISSHQYLFNKINNNNHNPVSLNGLFDTMLDLSGLSIESNIGNQSFLEKRTAERTVLTTSGDVIIH